MSGLTAFSSGRARFLRREFMRRTLLMRRTTAFAGDLPLPGCIHARESSFLDHNHDYNSSK
jgi:hypothetical protein